MNYELLFISIAVAYLIFVAVYSDLKQPIGTAIIRGTTEDTNDLMSHRSSHDMDRMHEYALLSAASYEKASYEELIEDSIKMRGLWVEELQTHTEKRLQQAIDEKVSGFHYQVFRRTQKSYLDKNVFAIVFRGTDSPEDFISNFRWMTQFIPGIKDQYDFVRVNTNKIVNEIYDFSDVDKENIEIITTGHSLGGGLAQQAAYATGGIKTVFAYAPSPVTGFYGVKKDVRDKRKMGLCIYRIHERGEVLAYLRRIMKLIYPVTQINPKILEIRFNFLGLSEDLISLHGIGPLAKSLRRAWENNA